MELLIAAYALVNRIHKDIQNQAAQSLRLITFRYQHSKIEERTKIEDAQRARFGMFAYNRIEQLAKLRKAFALQFRIAVVL